jgi:hypothetical protein
LGRSSNKSLSHSALGNLWTSMARNHSIKIITIRCSSMSRERWQRNLRLASIRTASQYLTHRIQYTCSTGALARMAFFMRITISIIWVNHLKLQPLLEAIMTIARSLSILISYKTWDKARNPTSLIIPRVHLRPWARW